MRTLRGLVLHAARHVVPVVTALALFGNSAAGCRKAGAIAAIVDDAGRRPATAPPPIAHPIDALFDGRLRLLGTGDVGDARPGATVPLTLYFLVEKECAGTDPTVFVHVAAPGAEVNQAGADHKLLHGKPSATEFRPGDVLVDTFEIHIPVSIGVDELLVWVGLYEGKDRWAASPRAVHDGANRVEVARLHVDGAPPFRMSAEIPQLTGPLKIDGVLDEPAWAAAPVLGPFVAWDGKTTIERATRAKMLWDKDALYLAFIGDDPDVFTPYQQRDDPLYDSEAVEIFIDADGDKDVYVELQAAPANDLHFDAAFAGGRRKNMDKPWDAAYETKSVVDTGGAHPGFVSEWRIPVKDLKGIPAGEPKVGASWKINLFRLERIRANPGNGKVTKNEASAWSSPLSGDFHNLDRFGTITFVANAPAR